MILCQCSEEVLLEHPFFKGYFVSNKGRILSRRMKKEKWLSPFDHHGYKRFNISWEGKKLKFFIHHWVAYMFCKGNVFLEIDHIDKNRANNCHCNLEWVTRQENLRRRDETPFEVEEDGLIWSF